MSREFQYLMQLISSAATGKRLSKQLADADWVQIENLATAQSIQFLLGYALKLNADIGCPKEIRDRLLRQSRAAAVLNATRIGEVIRMLSEMEAAGIHNVLFKGWSVATFYHTPEYRVSGDTDIWVDRADERKAIDFLKRKGFQITQRWKNGHHSECMHPVLGHLDLHVLFYDELVEDIWFNKTDGQEFVREVHLKVDSSYGSFFTLGHTDHLLYMILHLVKHFIQTGASLRMILDIAVFYAKNKDSIDSSRIWRVMDELKYTDLVNCVFWTAIRYFDFDMKDFPGISADEPAQMRVVLDDIEKGGWIGINDKAAREYGWYEYNRQMLLKKMRPWQYRLYMIWWQTGNLQSFFPNSEAMQKQYPILKKWPWLLPFAWIYRLFTRGVKWLLDGSAKRHIVSGQADLSEAGKERVDMFKKLNMM